MIVVRKLQTDTASVLQEASGYIKFLHAQLQVDLLSLENLSISVYMYLCLIA